MESNSASQHTSRPQSLCEATRTAMLITHSKTGGRLIHKCTTVLMGREGLFFLISAMQKKKISEIFQVMGNGGRWPDFFSPAAVKPSELLCWRGSYEHQPSPTFLPSPFSFLHFLSLQKGRPPTGIEEHWRCPRIARQE